MITALRYGLLFPVILLFTGLNLSAQEDTLWLKNGLVLHGEFQGLDIGVLSFDADVIGVVEVKFFDVATFTATSRIYRMKPLGGGERYGWILPGDTGRVKVYDLIDTAEVALSELVYLIGFEEKFLQRWNGLLSAGYSYTRSSRISRYNADVSAHYRGEKVNMDLSGGMILTGRGDSLAREREDANVVLNRLFSDRWSIFGAVSYQRNLTLGLRYRYQNGAGLSYRRYLTNRMRLAIGGGAVVNREESFERVSLNSIEAPLLLNFTFFKYRQPKISLAADQSVFFGITESGRLRHDGEIRLSWEVISDLSLQITFYDSYDSQSPSTGEALFDYGIVSGISYSF